MNTSREKVMEDDKLLNNRIMKYLLEHYFNNDRDALAKATRKSPSTVEYWFRKKPRGVNDDTLELLLYKINSNNKPIPLPDDYTPKFRQ